MTNLSKQTEGCESCRWDKRICIAGNRLLGSECPEYQKKPNKNRYTCFTCSDKKECKYAYDEYNHNGDCLASK
jgi:hypothetical protein